MIWWIILGVVFVAVNALAIALAHGGAVREQSQPDWYDIGGDA